MGKGGRQTERRGRVKTSQQGVICGRECVTDIKRNLLPSTEVGKSSIDEDKITRKNRFTSMKTHGEEKGKKSEAELSEKSNDKAGADTTLKQYV